MSETITFASPYIRLRLQIDKFTEKKGFHGSDPFIMPARLIEFDNGQFTTDDPEIIAGIRATPAYKRHEIIELKPGDLAPAVEKVRVIRGAISASDLNNDGPALQITERVAGTKATKCDVCGKEFPGDLSGAKVRMHKISHRRAAEAASVAEVPGDSPSLAEK